ncbi:hypothetical protein HOD83_03825 [Candidatus Woesearchaeota archaeon]|jgi:hypothetical protein|nr:hypothetical protein [Candidatus Woesearchaeota archaeon]MBT4114466.1 hypothetical protein [Candidatus Woesearchaeota archaeon]MBT4248681.1 hypothetical protein [Candidatus Woesearchaeota archaeon]
MFLYLSRKMGWVFAATFAAIAIGLYMYPTTARPIVGAVAAIGDRAAGGFLESLKSVL